MTDYDPETGEVFENIEEHDSTSDLHPRSNARPFKRDRWSESAEMVALTERLFGEIVAYRARLREHIQEDERFKEHLPDDEVLTDPQPDKTLKAMRATLCDLLHNYRAKPERFIAISMDNNVNNNKLKYGRSNPANVTYDIFVKNVIIGLKKLDYITLIPFYHDRENPEYSYSTRIHHTDKLAALFEEYDLTLDHLREHPNKEIIIKRKKADDVVREFTLADGTKKRKTFKIKVDENYDDCHTSNRLHSALKKYNKLISETYIDINFDFSQVEIAKPIYLDDKTNHRIFSNNSWSENGRYHGAWWQETPKDLRKYITINGEETVELDYKGVHFALLYARAGSALVGDPYSLPEYPLRGKERNLVKKLLIAMLYGKDAAGAVSSYHYALYNGEGEDYPEERYESEQLDLIIDVFRNHHSTISDEFGKDQSTKLMYYDAQIATHVIREMTKLKEPVLCVHDSFIVPKSAQAQLEKLMNEAFIQFTTTYRDFEGSIIDATNTAKIKPKELKECHREHFQSADYDRRLKHWKDTRDTLFRESCGVHFTSNSDEVCERREAEVLTSVGLEEQLTNSAQNENGMLVKLLRDYGFGFPPEAGAAA